MTKLSEFLYSPFSAISGKRQELKGYYGINVFVKSYSPGIKSTSIVEHN